MQPKMNKTVQNTQTKNYIQKLYEIKSIQPILFDLISSKGPAHKPLFDMKVTIKSINNIDISFTSNGASKKIAKLNCSKDALKYLVNIEDQIERSKYLNENEIIEIKSMFLTELSENSNNTNDVSAVGASSSVSAIDNTSFINSDFFMNDNTDKNENVLFKKFTETLKTFNDYKITTTAQQQQLKQPLTIQNQIEIENKTVSERNPIAVFTELLPNDSYQFDIISEWGESHAKQFKIQLIIKLNKIIKKLKLTPTSSMCNDLSDEKVFYAIGNSKKQAKLRVTQLALENLFNLKFNLNNTKNDIYTISSHNVDKSKFKRFADHLSEIIKQLYIDNLNETSSASLTNGTTTTTTSDNDAKQQRTVYAAIVQTTNGDEYMLNDANNNENMKIICLTTGTKCICGEYMSQNGSSINDCHAEILACRLLRRYLYQQLELFINYLSNQLNHQTTTINDLITNDNNFIFELKDNYYEDYYANDDYKPAIDANSKSSTCVNTLFRLKDSIKFHLFISSSPCGDGRVFSPHENHIGIDSHPNRKIRGILRAKLESGEGTIPVGNEIKLQAWDAILSGDRLKVMSCSDKLCKLNVTGVQGALLSHFIDTVYFQSIIIGSFYHNDHLSRALFGRIEEVSVLFLFIFMFFFLFYFIFLLKVFGAITKWF